MRERSILYVSSSAGLGHVIRDLEIAQELRRQIPKLQLSWLAAPPASVLIKDAGEDLLPEADMWISETAIAEKVAKGYGANIAKWVSRSRQAWKQNVETFKKAVRRKKFDLVIGDEAYELSTAIKKTPELKQAPFIMIYDCIGMEPMTINILERLNVYMWNRTWARGYRRLPVRWKAIFIGELEDVLDKKFGFLLPNRREYARERYEFVGYVVPFDPEDYGNRTATKSKLGYGKEPLIICSLGGTGIGKELLELCGQAYPIAKEMILDLRMVLVCGPNVSPGSLNIPGGIEVRGYVPALYEHFAASDLAIVMGGGTSTIELTALKRPFLYFPLEGHCEQEIHVAERLTRHQAGVRMSYSRTNPRILAEKIVSNLGKDVHFASIPTDGAKRVAHYIKGLFNSTLN